MTIKNFQFLSFVIFVHLLSPANAQQNSNQELVLLVNNAFTYNPRIHELQQQVFIQSEKMDIAKTYLLPSVNASGSYSFINPISQATFPLGPGIEKGI